jgi:hypothetical protein
MILPNIITEGDSSLLPLDETAQVTGFSFVVSEDSSAAITFFNFLAQSIQNDCDFGFIDEDISEHDLASIQSGITGSQIVLYIFFSKDDLNLSSQKKAEINSVIDKLSINKKIIIISNHNDIAGLRKDSDTIIIIPDLEIPSLASLIVKLSGRNADSFEEEAI